LIGRVEDREGEDAMSLAVLMARGRRGLQEAIQSLDGSRPDQRNRRAWLVDVLALFDELARLHTQAQTAALIHVRHLLATLVTRISPVLQEPQEPRRVPIHPLTNNVTVNAPPRPAVVEGRGWPLRGTVAA
jgi:hypothetical protein